ncbi:MAG TPA: peptidyl-prolyl cis-trans isomerase [bacterium]
MMQTFRKNMRLILFVALASFALLIFFQWGLDITGIKTAPETNIVVVDGSPISYNDYTRYVQGKENTQKGITRDEIWTMLLDDIMWNKLIQKERAFITDEEVWAIIKNNPPRQIYESEYLRNEKGEFDYNKYIALLRAPESQIWLQEYEMNIRRELPREKIRSLVSTMGWVSPFEDSMAAVKQTTTCAFSMVSMPIFKLRVRVKTDSAEVVTYYNEHSDEFTTPESKIVKYVFFERVPSNGDTNDARAQMDDFLFRMNEGENFDSVAREVSDDTIVEISFNNTGELPGHLAGPYQELKDGQTSGIIAGPAGFEVIQRVKKGLLRQAKSMIRVSPSTIGDIYDRIEAFKEAVKANGFENAAEEYGLEVHKSYPLNPAKVTFPIRDPEELSKFLSKNDLRQIAGPMNSMAGYYLFMQDSVIPAKTLDLNQNFLVVKARYEREKLKSELAQYMDRTYALLSPSRTLDQVAAEDTVLLFQKDVKNVFQIQREYGVEFAGTVAALEPNQTSKPLITDWAGYIIRCDARTAVPFDSSMAGYLQMARQMRLQVLSQSIFTPKKIVDNRDKFFE